MAAIAPAPVLPAPTEQNDNKNAAVTSTVSEVRSPSPTRNEVAANATPGVNDEFSIMRSHKKPPPKKDQPKPPQKNAPLEKFPIVELPHPIPPSGDVFEDVRVHLRCQKMFALNVEQLITQYMVMQMDLEKTKNRLRDTQDKLVKVETDLIDEKAETATWMTAYNVVSAKLQKARDDLRRARDDLATSKKEYHELEKQYDQAQNTIRNLQDDLRDAKRHLEQAKSDIKYLKDRIADLEEKLRKANDGENAANDRNADLTRLLYDSEAKKTIIERLKDQYEKEVREMKDKERGLLERIQHLQDKLRNPRTFHIKDAEDPVEAKKQ